MEKTLITFLLIFFLPCSFMKANDDIILSSYNGKNAIVSVSTSDFSENSFQLTFKITWVNSKLRPVKDDESVLALNFESMQVSPENSVGFTKQQTFSQFSNNEFTVDFFAMPDFEGGEVEVFLSFVYAENEEQAQLGNWQDILFSKKKIPSVTYFINGKLIKDIYAPKVRLSSPVVDKDSEEKLPIVDSKSVQIHISAYDKSGIKKIFINNREAKMSFTGEYVSKVTLYTGLNIIKVRAVDNFGNEDTYDFEIICSYQYDLDLRGGRFYALIVGINEYQDPNIPDLDKPVSDAEALKQVLSNLYTFDEENIFFLKNTTRSEFINKLDELASMLGGDDNLLIFYAGHGYWDDFKEIGYWMPSDAVVGDHSTWIRNSTIKEYIGVFKTKQTLLITDACFSGSIFKTRALHADKVVAYQKIYDLPGRKGMTSGTLKEVPDESIFLNTMLKRLKSNEDKYLPASSLFNNLRNAVLNNSPNVPQFGTIQGAGDEGGEFIFIKR